VPIGVVAIAASFRLIDESRDTREDQRPDVPGQLTSLDAGAVVVPGATLSPAALGARDRRARPVSPRGRIPGCAAAVAAAAACCAGRTAKTGSQADDADPALADHAAMDAITRPRRVLARTGRCVIAERRIAEALAYTLAFGAFTLCVYLVIALPVLP
jgi:hypothetical protein